MGWQNHMRETTVIHHLTTFSTLVQLTVIGQGFITGEKQYRCKTPRKEKGEIIEGEILHFVFLFFDFDYKTKF